MSLLLYHEKVGYRQDRYPILRRNLGTLSCPYLAMIGDDWRVFSGFLLVLSWAVPSILWRLVYSV
jgi:hypothetical protein